MSEKRQFKTTPLIKLGDEHFKKVSTFGKSKNAPLIKCYPSLDRNLGSAIEQESVEEFISNQTETDLMISISFLIRKQLQINTRSLVF